mgnify:CR=1 FL=1
MPLSFLEKTTAEILLISKYFIRIENPHLSSFGMSCGTSRRADYGKENYSILPIYKIPKPHYYFPSQHIRQLVSLEFH